MDKPADELISGLPRLVMIADVNVEQSSGGALLLHRLFKRYPVERLVVVYNPELAQATPEAILAGVSYRPFGYRIPRWIRNRFNPFWPVFMAVYMQRHATAVTGLLADFRPDAVLTVPHWYLWFTAAVVARRLGIPLHLIVHDDWPSYTTFRRPGSVANTVRWVCRLVMGRVYRQAATRLCVSPGMVDACRRWYGADGDVLYPSLGDDSPLPQVRVRSEPGGPPVIAFCGMIHQDGTTDLLKKLAAMLAEMGGNLDLYTLLPSAELAARGLGPPTVRVHGFFPAAEMGERLGRTAHALFLPASFELRERDDVATLFPSKLADYTAVGLPVLVWGPAYSSAIRWAAENPTAAVSITDPTSDAVRKAIGSIVNDPEYSRLVAAAGIEAGKRYFEVGAARRIVLNALRRGARAARS